MSDPDVQAALREMAGQIGGLQATVATMVSTWQSQEVNASQGRRDLHQKFDAMATKVSELAQKVNKAIEDITEIKPSVDAFETARDQAIGAQKLGKGIWAILVFLGLGTGSGFTWILANWISIGPRPPLH